MVAARATALLSAVVAAGAVVGSVFAAMPARADGSLSAPAKPVGGDQGAAVLALINTTRAANGCGPVAANPQLTASAAREANDMLANGVQSHTGSDGSTPAQRVKDAGYATYSKLGEIVFWATGPGGSPAAAVNWWMNSPQHRAIITDCDMTDAGFSAVSKGDRLTVAGDFARK
jgi:uncharacterized protein YkwD